MLYTLSIIHYHIYTVYLECLGVRECYLLRASKSPLASGKSL